MYNFSCSSLTRMIREECAKFGNNVFLYDATRIYTKTEKANFFSYYANIDGKCIVPDVFFCKKCNELVESKQQSGTNPLIRHLDKACPGSFVDLITDDFTTFLVNFLKVFGIEVSKYWLERELMYIGRVNNENM